jgi:serine/threonine protein kinase
MTVGIFGTPLFMPPEVLNGTGYSKKSDIFAVGIMMWMLLTKKTAPKDLYPNISIEAKILPAVESGVRPPVTKEFNTTYAKTMET